MVPSGEVNEHSYRCTVILLSDSSADASLQVINESIQHSFQFECILSFTPCKMAKIDRKRFECNALPKGWTREEVVRKTGLSAGTKDIFYYRYARLRQVLRLMSLNFKSFFFKVPMEKSLEANPSWYVI